MSEGFRFGIEEEYFVSCAQTLRPATTTPDSLFVKANLGREMLQAQLEVATRPHSATTSAADELSHLRTTAARSARERGFKLLACGTHPLGNWRDSVQTPKERYDRVMEGLQMLGRRNMLCGMHVHVELPEPSRRVEVMSRTLPYLPLFLALSTSSPFWEGELTGLKGYRLAAYDELPRTGLPDLFSTEKDYIAYIEAMTKSGVIADASHVWWSIRPSLKYPTLELRISDSCTRLDDAVAVAALYRALIRHLYRHPEINRRLTALDRALAGENKWRAQRYGTEMTFITRDGLVPIGEILEQLCEEMAADIEALDCVDEAYHCRNILKGGTSADRQIDVFRQHEDKGAAAALVHVCDWIARASC
jgi:glutamate---cysteine ligase / carboxylate-amine ligase